MISIIKEYFLPGLGLGTLIYLAAPAIWAKLKTLWPAGVLGRIKELEEMFSPTWRNSVEERLKRLEAASPGVTGDVTVPVPEEEPKKKSAFPK